MTRNEHIVTSTASPAHPRRTIRPAVPIDIRYLVHLQAKWTNNLGFLPRCALERYIDNRQVLTVLENNEPAGYLIWTFRKDGIVRIPQVAIDPELLRTTLGTKVMNHIRRAAVAGHCSIIRLKSRSDLKANQFWPGLGFRVTGVIARPSTRGLPLIEWTNELIPASEIAQIMQPTAKPQRLYRNRPKPHVKLQDDALTRLTDQRPSTGDEHLAGISNANPEA